MKEKNKMSFIIITFLDLRLTRFQGRKLILLALIIKTCRGILRPETPCVRDRREIVPYMVMLGPTAPPPMKPTPFSQPRRWKREWAREREIEAERERERARARNGRRTGTLRAILDTPRCQCFLNKATNSSTNLATVCSMKPSFWTLGIERNKGTQANRAEIV